MARCDQSCGDRRKANGNCPDLLDDGMPVQCVGPWVSDKHDPLGRYIQATRGPRKDYLPPGGRGGAAYIDLFAGPGRARVWSTGAVVDGSPLIALKHVEAPFTKVILCEKDPENAAALRRRTAHDGRVVVIEGDCHDRIDDIIAATPEHGLNFALIDPFYRGDRRTAEAEARIEVKASARGCRFSPCCARRSLNGRRHEGAP